MAQLVRAPPCHGGGRGFESRLGRSGSLAQPVEHNTFNVGVLGSSPSWITKRKAKRRQQKDKSYKINVL